MPTALAQRLSLCRLRHPTHLSVFNHTRSKLSAPGQLAFSRKMYSFTLEDLKASEWGEHPMANTAFSMKRARFHRWGFVIYRTTYGDDEAWDRYLRALKVTALAQIEEMGGDVLLEQYMDCRWTLLLVLRSKA